MSKNYELALKMDELQLKRLSVGLDDDYGRKEIEKKELELLSEDKEATIAYIRENCGEEELYHLSEIIEDLCRAINDQRLIDALYYRAEVLYKDFRDTIAKYGEPLIEK